MNSHPLFISNITVIKHTQLTSNIQGAIELFCFVPNYVELGNKNILAKKVGRITIKVGRDELVLTQNQFRTFLNAGIRMATGELETTILELGETPSLSFSVNEYHTTDMNEKYQAVIDGIYQTPVKENSTHENRVMGAYYLACAIKECMAHKDSAFIGNGYLWEKVSRAMRELGMPIKEDSA